MELFLQFLQIVKVIRIRRLGTRVLRMKMLPRQPAQIMFPLTQMEKRAVPL